MLRGLSLTKRLGVPAEAMHLRQKTYRAIRRMGFLPWGQSRQIRLWTKVGAARAG